MIYFDSAATSLQKPKAVEAAMSGALKTMSTPGRGSHSSAMLAANTALDCRMAIAGMFSVREPEQVVFTFNATHGLNIAINSLVKRGGRVVISGFEHNSVTRPVRATGADVKIAGAPLFEPEAAVAAFRRYLPGASAAVCIHVSNVFGYILPIKEISDLCRIYGVPLIIDASQSAGCIELDFEALDAEFVAMPGHKGLFGPQGTGVLLCRSPGSCRPLLAGGTGSDSIVQHMPDYLPDRLEAGTHNITGIAGLLAGVQYVQSMGYDKILSHERRLMERLAEALADIPGLHIFKSKDSSLQTGVLSMIYDKMSCENLSDALGEREIAVRAGLHCAPFAHRSAGSFETGTVRFSFSPFNTQKEVDAAADIIRDITKK